VSHPTYAQRDNSEIIDLDDIKVDFKPSPLFPKTLRQEATATISGKTRVLAGVSLMNSHYTPINATFNFSSKFFVKSKSVSTTQLTTKVKPVPKDAVKAICPVWFSKVLKTEERILVCSTVDREIVKILRKMQSKCRERRNATLPELLSVGF